MRDRISKPLFFSIGKGEAFQVEKTPYGEVGKLYSDAEIEAVWISKQGEEIDPQWFSQDVVDLIFVIQGQLKIEFEAEEFQSRVMEPGDFMILPPGTRCRAYRWPRDRVEAAKFLAVYHRINKNE